MPRRGSPTSWKCCSSSNVRLPNFAEDPDLNSLRTQMGATEEGNLSLTSAMRRLTPEQLQQLTTDGIDVPSLAEIRPLGDGTLAYRDRRVLVYIRDSVLPGPQAIAEDEWAPFHVANCETMRALRSRPRGLRYVVSAETGLLQKRLRVCQDCLAELQYEGTNKGQSKLGRQPTVHGFTVERFYHLWPRELPEAQAAQAILLDDFGGDFGRHAAEAMAIAHYRCTKCGIDLSAAHLRRFLHVHHRDIVKHDNPLSELVVLCIGCHANQSGHGLMRALLDFSEFSVLARG
jgi:hypothetical protein